MQHQIIKLCADALRGSLNAKHGIKLKSGHAHEITAAVLGYKSSIALHSDDTYPMANLDQAEFILLDDRSRLVDQRLTRLDGLPERLPASDILMEYIYSEIHRNEAYSGKVQTNIEELATLLADVQVNRQLHVFRITQETARLEKRIEVQETLSGYNITVSYDSPGIDGKRSRYSWVDIHLQRVAGNIGYVAKKIWPTSYAGQFRDPDFNSSFDTNLLPIV